MLTCNENDISSVISFLLADSTHFTFKTKLPEVKTANEFAFYIRKKVRFYTQSLNILCNNDIIIHQRQ